MNRIIGFLAVFLGLLQSGFAQQTAGVDSIYNINSPMFPTAERIAYYEQLYRFRITRFVDLKERQNAGFSSAKSNIGGLILDLVQQNKLKPFSGAYGDPADFEYTMADSDAMVLSQNFTKSQTRGRWTATESYQAGEKVIVAVTNEKGITEDNVYAALQDNTGKDPQTNGSFWQDQGGMNVNLDQQAVVGIEIIEDAIFDKRKSRLTYDILAIGVVILDAASGTLQTRFYIKYADLSAQVEKIMRSPKAVDRASVMWQNRYNPSENKKFTDAFKLRLFHGVIRMVENPDRQLIMDTIYNKSSGKGSYAEGVFAMWEKEMELMEKEHNLWEY
jgi:Gliding motility associated protein GldN